MSTVPEKFKFRIATLPFWFSLLVILIRGVGATLNLTADCQFNIGDAGSEVTSELTVPDPPPPHFPSIAISPTPIGGARVTFPPIVSQKEFPMRKDDSDRLEKWAATSLVTRVYAAANANIVWGCCRTIRGIPCEWRLCG